MPQQRLDIADRPAVLHTGGGLCRTTQELAESETIARVLHLYVDRIEAHDPEALAGLGLDGFATDGPHEAAAALLDLIAASPAEKGDPRR